MSRLSAADLSAALDFVAEAHAFEDVDAFRHGILPGLQRLLPSDLVGYNEVDPGGEALVLTYPWKVPDAVNFELPRLAHQHPLICVQMNGDKGTYKISDFLSARQFHALELYAGLYSELGAEDQIAFGLPGPVVIGIAMNRDRRSFGERDRALLELLRPHLAQAYRGVVERERAAVLLAALERGLSDQNAAVIILDRVAEVAFASSGAMGLLAAYFTTARGPDGALPEAVVEWLARADALAGPAPLTVDREHGRLTIGATPQGEGEWALTLEEDSLPTPESLLELGLTRRQAEVLALLAAGAGVAEIADGLHLSPATVRKHLEHIYARLGVHSRAEAVARAREVAVTRV